MVAEHDLQIAREITRRVLSASGDRVLKVILHGSRATGEARRTSDYDILVVMRDPVDDWVSESMRLTDLFNVSPWSVDLQVFGETEFEECRTVPGTLPCPASTRGISLHRSADWIEPPVRLPVTPAPRSRARSRKG
jgi:predicted nucleotidyltransferase